MIKNKISGYLWVTLGLFFIIFFGGKLIFQLLTIALGVSLITKGLRILAVDRAVYNYSMHYFNDNFRK